MCGRFNLTATPEAIAGQFALPRQPNYQPSYNITPSQKILCIVGREDRTRKPANLYWGLVPPWAKDTRGGVHLINARAETIREKPSFRAAFNQRRCLVVATGFYEWQNLESGKQAFHIHRQDNGLFAFAGLWEHWQHGQESLYSCAVITTAANALMQPIHSRMPVIIPPGGYAKWLDKTATGDDVSGLLDNPAYGDMAATAISGWVNNPRHNDERCLA